MQRVTLFIPVSIVTSADRRKLLDDDSGHISDPLLSSQSTTSEQMPTTGHESTKSLASNTADRHHKVPVFHSEEDRVTFDRCLQVDIATLVSGMYTSQTVKQNATDGINGTTRTLFTCTTCGKVFTSLSHCQLHCLTHVSARPYRCPWCSYSTNIRG